jgi:pentatricopeptide repeat protein
MDRKNQAYACNTILSAWGNHARHVEYNDGIVDRASAFAQKMQERGLIHTAITYNALLKVMAACGEPELAEDLLREMKNGPVKPDIVSYSIVVDAYAKARRPAEAHEIHRFMTVPPNVVSFNSLIHAYSKSDAPESAERANSVLKEMTDAAVSPDLMTYCSQLTVWSNTNHTDKAQSARAVLDSMVASYKDLAPLHRNAQELLRNAQTMVVAACAYLPHNMDCPAEDLERIHQIARQTYGEIQEPTFVTYATYMLALHRLETDEKTRYRSVREVFLSYCKQERNAELNSLVLRRLKMAIPAQLLHAEILQEGQRMHAESRG